MNRYPNFIDPTCSSYGEYEDTPDWFVIFWSAVVVVGVGFCAWMAVMP